MPSTSVLSKKHEEKKYGLRTLTGDIPLLRFMLICIIAEVTLLLLKGYNHQLIKKRQPIFMTHIFHAAFSFSLA